MKNPGLIVPGFLSTYSGNNNENIKYFPACLNTNQTGFQSGLNSHKSLTDFWPGS
jgi:hypothetical protein